MNRRYTNKKDSNIKLRFVGLILFIVLMSLQASLWGTLGLLELWDLSRGNTQDAFDNEKLRERNRILAEELADLKDGGSVIEELAREELGMVKPGETFFKVIENRQTTEDTLQ